MEFNLADLWEAVADTHSAREALVCGTRRLSYADVEARANRLAHVLEAHGIGPGDRVGVYLYNGTEYLETMLAAFKLRAVPVNVNYRYVEDELAYLLDDCDAKAVVFHRELAPKLAAIRDRLPRLTHFLVVDDDCGLDTAKSLAALGALRYEEALALALPDRDFADRSPDDLYILYTGGTTGQPKGVMWRAEDIFFAALGGGSNGREPIAAPEDITDNDDVTRRCLPACPFMHGTAQWFAFDTLFAGGTVVISPEHRFDPALLWELVVREHVSFLVIVGDAFARPLVEAIDTMDPRPDVSRLSAVLSGGAILSPAVKAEWIEALPETILIDGFGSSETGGQGAKVSAAGSTPTGLPRFRLDTDTAVLGDDLRPAAVGVIGRLARRGRLPVGYHKDPERTAATFPVVDGVRWSIPGDHARLEADGTITVLGRGSVSINTGGEKVYPEEVEAVLKAHDDVFDAVVVGVPDERWGERVVAVVAPRAGAHVALDELVAHGRSQLAPYKLPRAMVIVDHVVRSPAGKPDYRWAHARAESGAAADDADPATASAPR